MFSKEKVESGVRVEKGNRLLAVLVPSAEPPGGGLPRAQVKENKSHN